MTNRTFDLRAIIRVMDRASAPLRRIGGSFRRLAAMARLSQMATAFRGVTDAVGNLTAGLRRFVSLGATLGAGAMVAAVMQVSSGFAQAGDNIAKTADRLGVGIEALQEFRHAADLSGVQTRTFDISMQRLNRRMAEALAGRNQNVATLFDRLGISLRDANGEVRTATDVLPELADAFAANTNASVRTRMAFTLFDRDGVALVNMLAAGSERLAEMREEARALGMVIGEEAARESEGYIDTLTRFRGATMGLRNAIGAQLIPVLQPLIESFTQWIAANREIIAQRVAEFVDRVVEAIGAINWQAVGEWFSDIASAASAMAEAVGGWDNLALVMAGVFSADLIANVAGLAGALARFGVVLLFNPIVLAATAIAGAAYLIWKHWDEIVDFFRGLWGDIVGIFRDAWELIRPIVDLVVGSVDNVVSAAGSLLRSPLDDASRTMLVGRPQIIDLPLSAYPEEEHEEIIRQIEAGEHPYFEAVNRASEGRAGIGLAEPAAAGPDILGNAQDAGALGMGADGRPTATVGVHVEVANAPPGTTVTVDDDGDVDTESHVAYSLAGQAGTAY